MITRYTAVSATTQVIVNFPLDSMSSKNIFYFLFFYSSTFAAENFLASERKACIYNVKDAES